MSHSTYQTIIVKVRSVTSNITVTPNQIRDLLQKVHPTKSAGDDKMHPRILQECAVQLSQPLQIIFQKSLDTGIFPDAWKTATVTPIHKSEERDLSENYRPISITSQVGKILEKIVRKGMMKHIIDCDYLSPHQHGFCERRSCMTNLLEALDDITELVDSGIPVDEVFLDFKKAFDKVSHSKLLYKLHQMGFNDNLLLWIESFITDRKQRVKVGKGLSSWPRVTSGVPQGSVLGPLLFLVFINDLPMLLETNCKLFADDAKLYGSVSTREEQLKLQDDLRKCEDWAKEWSMDFHPRKCKVLHFGKKNTKFSYKINGNEVHQCQEEKDLGITITDDLKWDAHIAACIAKGNKMIGMIRRTFSHIDKDMFNCLYKTFVRPTLEYAPQVWNPYLEKHINALEKVQRRATKIVPELKDKCYEDRLLALKLYPLKDRRLRGDMITTFKMMNGLIDVDNNRLIPIKKETPSISTRSHNQQIKGKRYNTLMRKNVFSQRIVLSWNGLSNDTVDSNSIATFKERYDKEMLGKFQ